MKAKAIPNEWLGEPSDLTGYWQARGAWFVRSNAPSVIEAAQRGCDSKEAAEMAMMVAGVIQQRLPGRLKDHERLALAEGVLIMIGHALDESRRQE